MCFSGRFPCGEEAIEEEKLKDNSERVDCSPGEKKKCPLRRGDRSLQCRRILDKRVYIFVFGGLGPGNISRGSKR